MASIGIYIYIICILGSYIILYMGDIYGFTKPVIPSVGWLVENRIPIMDDGNHQNQ